MRPKIRTVVFISLFIMLPLPRSYGQSPQVSYGWTKIMGGTAPDYSRAIAMDSSGNVYVTGDFQGTVDFGRDFATTDVKISAGSSDIFVTKINSKRTYGWTKTMGGGLGDIGYGIAADASGNVYVAGDFQGTVDFGRDFGRSDVKAAVGGVDMFITKINADGTYGWSKTIGGVSSEDCQGVAVDTSGNLYLTGDFWDGVDFGRDFGTSDFITSRGEQDLFVTKINADLSYAWTRTLGAYDSDHGRAVAVDPSGNVYVTGMRDYYPHQEFPIVILKLSADGTYGWVKHIYGTYLFAGGTGQSIATDSSGNIFLTGSFSGTVDFGEPFGATDVKTSQRSDIFLMKVKADGRYGWTTVLGGTGNDQGSGISTDSSANLYVTGSFEGTVDFGLNYGLPDVKTAAGRLDVFVTKINANGTYAWTKAMGGTADDIGSGISADAFGLACVTGSFQSSADFARDFGETDIKTSAGGSDAFVTRIGKTYSLTIAAGPGGTTSPAPGSYAYLEGASITVLASAAAAYRFDNWTGDASGSDNPVTVVMTADKSIRANFSRVVKPPLNVTGEKLANRAVSMVEYVARLRWQANAANTGTVGARIYRIEDGRATPIADVTAGTLEYIVRRLQPKQPHRFGVTAVNSQGWESDMVEVTVQ